MTDHVPATDTAKLIVGRRTMNKLVAMLTAVAFACSTALALPADVKTADKPAAAPAKKALAKAHKLTAKNKLAKDKAAKAKLAKKKADKDKTKPLSGKNLKADKSKPGKAIADKHVKSHARAKLHNKAAAKVNRTSAKPVSVVGKSSKNL